VKKSFGAFKVAGITFAILFLIGMVFVSAGGRWKTIRTNGAKIDILYELKDNHIILHEIDIYIDIERLARNFNYQIKTYNLIITVIDLENETHVVANLTIVNFVEDVSKVYTNIPKTKILKITEKIATIDNFIIKTKKEITYHLLKSFEESKKISNILGITGLAFLVAFFAFAVYEIWKSESE